MLTNVTTEDSEVDEVKNMTGMGIELSCSDVLARVPWFSSGLTTPACCRCTWGGSRKTQVLGSLPST